MKKATNLWLDHHLWYQENAIEVFLHQECVFSEKLRRNFPPQITDQELIPDTGQELKQQEKGEDQSEQIIEDLAVSWQLNAAKWFLFKIWIGFYILRYDCNTKFWCNILTLASITRDTEYSLSLKY